MTNSKTVQPGEANPRHRKIWGEVCEEVVIYVPIKPHMREPIMEMLQHMAKRWHFTIADDQEVLPFE